MRQAQNQPMGPAWVFWPSASNSATTSPKHFYVNTTSCMARTANVFCYARRKNRRSSVCAGRKRPTTHAGSLPAEWVCARYALKANSARYAPGITFSICATPSVLKNYTQGYAPKVCAVYIYVKNLFFNVISDGYAPGMRRGKNKENKIHAGPVVINSLQGVSRILHMIETSGPKVHHFNPT